MSSRRIRTGGTALLAAASLLLTGTSTAATAPPEQARTTAEWNTDRAAAAYAANPSAASASGSQSGETGPGEAFDADPGSHWTSDAADGAWVSIDLGAPLRLTQVRLDWGTSYGEQYALEISANGTDWKSFYTEKSGSGGSVTLRTYPQEVVGRYVRMRGVERSSSGGYELSAFQVLGGEPAPASTSRTNLALFHPAYGDHYQDAAHSPAFATDGGAPADLRGDSTRWASDWHKDRWIAVDLGARSQISSVDLYWEASYAVDYRIQVSDDNATWRTVHQPSQAEVERRRADIKSPGEAAGLHDTIELSSPATARYVRMLGVERRSFHNPAPATAQFGYSLYEFQVWGTGGDAAAAYPALPRDPGTAYRTVFSDEFDAGALDRGKWRVVRTGETMGSVNGESQAYVDSTDAVRTENGSLVLASKYCKGCTQAPNGQTYDFTSGRIDTNTKFDFTYGRVSARMKLPVGDGFWPAFWLLGSNVDDPSVSWPASGEIDAMENIGYADWTSSAVHGPGYAGDGNVGAKQTFPAGQSIDQWHTYSVEWTPEAVRYYVDDRQVTEVTRQKLEATRGQWVFDHDHYVILNLALGGAYPAGYNGVTQPYWGLPQSSVDKVAAGGVRAEIDWVKVEQKR